MDIAQLSMAMSQNNVMQGVSLGMLSKSLDLAKNTGDQMTKMMEQSVNPNLGASIDIMV